MADNRSAEDFRAERVRLELQLQRANSQGARQFVMDEMKLLDQEEAAARSTTTAGIFGFFLRRHLQSGGSIIHGQKHN